MTGGGALAAASTLLEPAFGRAALPVNTPVILYTGTDPTEAKLAKLTKNFYLLDFWRKSDYPLRLHERAR